MPKAVGTLLALVGALLIAAPARAAITITFGQPAPPPTAPTLVGLSLNVSVRVVSTYELRSVHAQVETVGADLVAGSTASEPWTGVLAVGLLSRGTKTLVITATDMLDNVATSSVDFVHDNPPVITVTSPLDGA